VRSLITVFVSLYFVANAAAQLPLPAEQNEEAVKILLKYATQNIQNAYCKGSNRCEPATTEELANPPLTLSEAKQITDRGALSGSAVHCNFDWEGRNFKPMMAYWREVQKKNERQMALVTLLHGIAQGLIAPSGMKFSCSDQTRKELEARLDFVAR
jgi:hypothetical protein